MKEVVLQIHSGVWGILVLLFIFSFAFYRQKGWIMGLRLSYLVMIITGIWLLFLIHFPIMFLLKGVLAILLIGLMEMVLGRRKKQKSTVPFLVLLAIDLILILLIGYKII